MPDVRMIDANALRKDIHMSYSDDLGILEHIDNSPTIDAQPVKRGKWSECWRDPVRNIISVICSTCGDASVTHLPRRDLTVDDVQKKICIQMPYCPKCGAKMDGESDA